MVNTPYIYLCILVWIFLYNKLSDVELLNQRRWRFLMLLIWVCLSLSMRNCTIYTPISRIKKPISPHSCQTWVLSFSIFSLETLVNFWNKPLIKKAFFLGVPVAHVYFGMSMRLMWTWYIPLRTRWGRCLLDPLTCLLPSSHPLGWSQWWYRPERDKVSRSAFALVFQVVKAFSGDQCGIMDAIGCKNCNSFIIYL